MYDDDDVPPRRGGGVGTTIVVSILTSALVSVAVFVGGPRLGLSRLMGSGARSAPADVAQRVRVPRVLTMPPESAREVAGARGLRLKTGDTRPDPQVPLGWIVEQSPAEGTSVARQSEIAVTLSSGPPPTAVPRLQGMRLAEARQAVEAAGLRVGIVEPAGATEQDQVASSTPPSEAMVSRDTAIRLTVVRSTAGADGGVAPAATLPTTAAHATDGAAAPAANAEVEVPGLRGKPLRRASELLEQAGLRLGGRRTQYDEAFGSGVVLRQTPAAGARVARGSAVDVVVNQGD